MAWAEEVVQRDEYFEWFACRKAWVQSLAPHDRLSSPFHKPPPPPVPLSTHLSTESGVWPQMRDYWNNSCTILRFSFLPRWTSWQWDLARESGVGPISPCKYPTLLVGRFWEKNWWWGRTLGWGHSCSWLVWPKTAPNFYTWHERRSFTHLKCRNIYFGFLHCFWKFSFGL